MGGVKRHTSPTGVEPGSPKVAFAGVTGMSRPVTHDEHWTLYFFEAHAAQCPHCRYPSRVSREGRRLCTEGRDLAIDVAQLLVYRDSDDQVYSRVRDGHKEVRVEVPHGYEHTFSLLKAINRTLRHGAKSPSRPKSRDKTYFVDDRVPAAHRERGGSVSDAHVHRERKSSLSERRSSLVDSSRPTVRYDTRIVEPKGQRPAPRPRPDSHDAQRRGSLYGLDLIELDRMERREQQLRYNVELREPSYKARRHHNVFG